MRPPLREAIRPRNGTDWRVFFLTIQAENGLEARNWRDQAQRSDRPGSLNSRFARASLGEFAVSLEERVRRFIMSDWMDSGSCFKSGSTNASRSSMLIPSNRGVDDANANRGGVVTVCVGAGEFSSKQILDEPRFVCLHRFPGAGDACDHGNRPSTPLKSSLQTRAQPVLLLSPV